MARGYVLPPHLLQEAEELGLLGRTVGAIAKETGKGPQTIRRRLDAGRSLHDALYGHNPRTSLEFAAAAEALGLAARTPAEVSREVGIPVARLYARMKSGDTLAQAIGDLERRPTSAALPGLVDAAKELGLKGRTMEALAEELGIPRSTLDYRLKALDMSFEEAFTLPARPRGPGPDAWLPEAAEALGLSVHTVPDLAEYAGIPEKDLRNRLNHGMSLEDALARPVRRRTRRPDWWRAEAQALGLPTTSLADLARGAGISPNTLAGRLHDRSLSLEEALTRPKPGRKAREFLDEAAALGIVAETLAEAAAQAGISPTTLDGRRAANWPVAKALGLLPPSPLPQGAGPPTEAEIEEAARVHGRSPEEVRRLVGSGLSLAEAVTADQGPRAQDPRAQEALAGLPVEVHGSTDTLTAHAEQWGIPVALAVARLEDGWTLENALVQSADRRTFVTGSSSPGRLLKLARWFRRAVGP